MLVWSRPTTPDQVDEYNHWYDTEHLKEVLDLPGFTSARRLKHVDHWRGATPPQQWLAIYEVEAETLSDALDTLLDKSASGEVKLGPAIQMDPRPVIQLYRTVTSTD